MTGDFWENFSIITPKKLSHLSKTCPFSIFIPVKAVVHTTPWALDFRLRGNED
jgi:hypothetical protein